MRGLLPTLDEKPRISKNPNVFHACLWRGCCPPALKALGGLLPTRPESAEYAGAVAGAAVVVSLVLLLVPLLVPLPVLLAAAAAAGWLLAAVALLAGCWLLLLLENWSDYDGKLVRLWKTDGKLVRLRWKTGQITMENDGKLVETGQITIENW